ncbi:hypothetical protein HO173_013003 [Letharia columbiana]|uniref:Uncharacterized protein n=1 Tax=Letharia columbiana TaxID=112416 RepID=A0A8H6CJ91_9LECA|nr:uncharacterized protein HO173_013003 [Letharia columbiana]KAF6224563.1 hypothetical protein HO173_013003 [Letharia columbiana]
MIEYARRASEETGRSINADAFRVPGPDDNSDTLISFGISLVSGMVTVQGRLLEQPAVSYQKDSTARVIDEKGRWNLRGVSKVFKPGQLEKWGILRITRDEKDLRGEQSTFDESFRSFLATLRNYLCGNKLDKSVHLGRQTIYEGHEDAINREFDRCVEQDICFLIIVLPDSDASTYNHIEKDRRHQMRDQHCMCLG